MVVPEVDGARLVGSSRHELVRKVPDSLAQVRVRGLGFGVK